MSLGKFPTPIEMEWWLIKSYHDIRLSLNIHNQHICKNNENILLHSFFEHAYQYRFSQTKTKKWMSKYKF